MPDLRWEISQCRRHGKMHDVCMVRYVDLIPIMLRRTNDSSGTQEHKAHHDQTHYVGIIAIERMKISGISTGSTQPPQRCIWRSPFPASGRLKQYEPLSRHEVSRYSRSARRARLPHPPACSAELRAGPGVIRIGVAPLPKRSGPCGVGLASRLSLPWRSAFWRGRLNSACEFYVFCVLGFSPTHCERPSKREHDEE